MEIEQLSVREESVMETLTVGLVETMESSMETASETADVAEEVGEDDGAAIQLENMEKHNEEIDQGGVCGASVGVSTAAEATGVMDEVVVAEAASASIVAERLMGAVFEQSNCFTGTRSGYVFTSGQNGVGYYRDHRKAKLTGNINATGGKKSAAMAAAENRYRRMDRGMDQYVTSYTVHDWAGE
jgi:hypothetical protein